MANRYDLHTRLQERLTRCAQVADKPLLHVAIVLALGLLLWLDHLRAPSPLTLLALAAPVLALACLRQRVLAAAATLAAVLVVGWGSGDLERALAAALLLGGVAWAADRVGTRDRRFRDELSRLEQRAFHDPLTGLPNRMLLLDRLAVAIAHARRSNRMVAVLALDLDGFKEVNDRFGHARGDEVLRAIAVRLAGCVRSVDTVARIGGDEFAIVLSPIERIDQATHVADKVLQVAAEPVALLRGPALRVGASIGIVVFPQHGAEIDRLLERADAALYDSKQRGRNTWTCHATDAGPSSAPWFTFGAEHEIDVPEIDQQHRHLIWLTNELNRSTQAGQSLDATRRRFDEIVLYARFHFATEERWMRATDYPGYRPHLAAHERLIADLARFRERLHEGGELAALQMLKAWLQDHIVTFDHAMGRHLVAARHRWSSPMPPPPGPP